MNSHTAFRSYSTPAFPKQNRFYPAFGSGTSGEESHSERIKNARMALDITAIVISIITLPFGG